ncbi:MAG: beta-N-acetylhexosaminidase [Polyangiaceae bacterium]
MTPAVLAGQLLVVGFAGAELPLELARQLAAGTRAGVILFRRNLPDLPSSHALLRAVAAVAANATPPFVGVDEEGGRVRRLPAPFPGLPPMRSLGLQGDEATCRATGAALGKGLRAVGFNLDFAPVLDVDTNPDNPVIGDRAFSSEPDTVARLALAFAAGLRSAGIIPCGKHFPGHGDTETDSHLTLPRVTHSSERIESIELAPFRAAAAAGLECLMSAHVVFDALDPGVPATLSSRIATRLLREELGFRGVLFSDDLEMRALAGRMSIEESAVGAILAGCDVLLVCEHEELAERAHAALARECECSPAFRRRAEQAAERSGELRRRNPPRPVAPGSLMAAIEASGLNDPG